MLNLTVGIVFLFRSFLCLCVALGFFHHYHHHPSALPLRLVPLSSIRLIAFASLLNYLERARSVIRRQGLGARFG
ncbi:hypothetical protein BJ165DRAFT_416876 [Panaeolus papilionaceus]|nr:hypothetical protein BJ165DRAFT_416876 [Panaeolus papilionaceus]